MTSGRYIIVISSVLLFTAGIAIGCWDFYDPFESNVNLFQSNTAGQPQFSSFAFTNEYTVYGMNFGDGPDDEIIPDGNITEWYDRCKGKVKRADIDSFLNTFDPVDVRALAQVVLDVPAKVKSNSFSRFLLQPPNKDLLSYMVYAKQCEPLNAEPGGHWGKPAPMEDMPDSNGRTYVADIKDTSSLQQMIATGVSRSYRAKTDFLKWRYIFQALRLAFYNGDDQETLDLYEQLVGSRKAENIMYPRCLALKAGALLHTGHAKLAAYTYSKAFDLNDDVKIRSYLSYLWATDSLKTTDLLPLCKNKHEQAMLWVMAALHERQGQNVEGLQAMQKAYALDPGVKGLSTIMTREINKGELRYMQKRESMERVLQFGIDYSFYRRITANDKKKWLTEKNKQLAYLNNLNAFAQQVASSGKMKDKAFWNLASSYLYYMQDRFVDCKKYLDIASTLPMNANEHYEHDVINILCIVHKTDKLTAETEAELLPALQWLERHKGKSHRYKQEYKNMLITVLTDKYIQQQDTVKALYCLARGNMYTEDSNIVAADFTDVPGGLLEHISISKLHEVQAFVSKKGKSDFEKWLTYKTPYPAEVLMELEGTKYIRQMRFEKAIAVLAKLAPAILSKTALPDVLAGHLRDSQDWNATDSATTYNKLQFAKKMVQLENKLHSDHKNSNIAYQYANALYSMSYYGKANHAFTYYRRTSDGDAYFLPDRNTTLPGSSEYYGIYRAMKYYLIACDNTTDKEMKARCLFMAAKCWQKNCPTRGSHNSDGYFGDEGKAYYLNSLKSPYLARLNREYKHTKLYQEAYSSCSYLRDYALFH